MDRVTLSAAVGDRRSSRLWSGRLRCACSRERHECRKWGCFQAGVVGLEGRPEACPTKKADWPGGHNRLKPVPPWTGQEACPTKIMSLAGRASLLGRRPTPDCPPRSACSVARPVLYTPLTVAPDRAR